MRILHVVPTYVPAYRYGGPIASVHGLARALVELGHDVHVATTNVDGPNDLAVPLGEPVDVDGVKVHYFPVPMLRRLYFSPRLRIYLDRNCATMDIVHLHSVFLWPTNYAARAAHRARVPYVLSPRGMLVPELIRKRSRWIKQAWITLVEKKTIRNAAIVHATSKIEREKMDELGLNYPRRVVVPNGVNALSADSAQTAFAHREDPPVVLFVGRLNWKKGLESLFRAFARLTGASLVIAGPDEEGYRQALEQLAKELGIEDRVRFEGLVDGAGKDDLYRQATLVVLPSLSENFGNVVIEAMQRARPVVVSPDVGAAPLVEEAKAGLVVHSDPETLGNAMAQLLNDPKLAQTMGQGGQEYVKQQLEWSSIAARFVDVYAQA